METIKNLLMGFSVLLTPENMLYSFGGVLIGQIVGILPGLGSVIAIAVLLPFTYSLDPIPALVAFCGIYYGSQFGGAISSILINAPGTESAVMTTVDGYPMAKKGQAGRALGTAAISSFTGGMAGSILVVLLAGPLVQMIISFAAPEYLALMIFAMACITGMAEKSSQAKSIVAICTGLALGTIGLDVSFGAPRMTFGSLALYEGISFIILAIGVFAMAEVMRNVSNAKHNGLQRIHAMEVVGRVGISLKDWKLIIPTHIRCTLVGFFIGVLPGVGAATATPLCYSLEKKIIGEDNAEWGKGEIRGVAAPESANNSCAMGALMPLLTLGVPGSSSAAIMLTAFMILGIQPGPLLFQNHPDILWALLASFFIGNIMLLVINLPLVRYCVKLVQVPTELLFMSVWILAIVGSYAVGLRVFDVGMICILSVLGVVYGICKIPLAPMLVAILLGDMIEYYLAATIVLCRRSFVNFMSRPIVLLFLVLAVLVIVLPMLRDRFKKNKVQSVVDIIDAPE
jgi:putative tricarboxylic transport membrane protein